MRIGGEGFFMDSPRTLLQQEAECFFRSSIILNIFR
jgi:hypothetical protein